MVEMLAATLSLPTAPVVRAGVTLALAPPMQRLSLRTRDVAALNHATGLTLPTRIGDLADGVAMLGPDEWLAMLNSSPERGGGPAQLVEGHVGLNPNLAASATVPVPLHHPAATGASTRPASSDGLPPADHFVRLRPPPRAGEDLAPISIVDVSSRSIGITVTGPLAAETIGAGCPLDVARMAPGRATRTLFETVEIVLVRHSAEQFYIDVWRSFAPWLFAALVAAAPS